MPKTNSAIKKSKGLYKRKGFDNYYADLGRDNRGHRIRRSTGTSDRQKAQKKYDFWVLEESIKRLNPSKFASKEPYPFSMAASAYAEYLKRKNAHNFKQSSRYLLKIAKEEFGDIPCDEIGTRHIQSFIDKRVDAGLSAGTVKRDVSILSAILHKAYNDEYIDRKPRIPSVKVSTRSRRILEPDEETRLLHFAPNHLKAIIIFALETGARKGEILSLNWKNVDLSAKRIKFIRTKNGKDRVMPMTDKCYDLLNTIDRHIAAPVFSFNGHEVKDIKSSYKTAKQKAGIRGLTFHDLRHTFASRFIMRGGQQQALMKMLGHSSPSMTQRYTHLSHNYLADAMSVMNKSTPDYKHE